MLQDRLIEAGNRISAKEAKHRVLISENPRFAGEARITTSLFSGLQLVLPGELPPAHRHSQPALPFIVKGSGGQRAVDGERTIMEEGDFVITPPGRGTITAPDGDSGARYGANMLPVDYRSSSPVSPLFAYPYARTREALEAMKQRDEWDPRLEMRYTNSNDGGHTMPTIGAFIQLLPKGFTSKRYQSTDATVFVCVKGKGKTRIGRTDLEWGPHDIFVAPSWHPVVHEASAESVLFSCSDRPVQEKLGLWRESRG